MSETRVRAFLNDRFLAYMLGQDRQLHPGQLRMVYHDKVANDFHGDQPLLDFLFERFNSPSGHVDRQFSIGDVITLDNDRSFVCERDNWRRLPYVVDRM